MNKFPKTLGRFLPNAVFTHQVEMFFEKENPDKVVPWPKHPIPSWAYSFRPRVFLDLGSGLGGQTSATLMRLAQWGCLEKLERVVLVDRDTELYTSGAQGLRRHLESRISNTLLMFNLTDIEVQAHVEELTVARNEDNQIEVDPLAKICPEADLILASHVTYYFGDGSGRELIEGLLQSHISSGGKLWVNIRDLNCPVYSKRYDTVKSLGLVDEQPFDYSEYFYSDVIPNLAHMRLIDTATIGVDVRPGVDRVSAAYLAMWRTNIDPDDEHLLPMLNAAQSLEMQTGPVFSETHFIIAHDE